MVEHYSRRGLLQRTVVGLSAVSFVGRSSATQPANTFTWSTNTSPENYRLLFDGEEIPLPDCGCPP